MVRLGSRWAVLAFFLIGFTHAELARATKILMHGRVADPYATDARGDGAVLDHLIGLFGEGNVAYLAGASAQADGSSADGYDAIVISSSLGSNDIRNKYEDSPKGILFWENALLKLQAGDFQISDDSGNKGALPAEDNRRFLTITDPTHPLAAGLSGDVEVYLAAADTQFARGNLAPGVHSVATIKGTTPTEYGIAYADAGAELLGDGSDGKPSTAAGKRVMFFLSDSVDRVVFDLLTDDGLKLFDAAVNWVATGPAAPSADLNGDTNVDAADAGIMFAAWGENPGSPANLNGDGFVDAADAGIMFASWTGDPAVPGAHAATAEYNYVTGELKVSSADAVNLFVQSASNKITPLSPAPTVPVGLLTNNSGRVGITNLGPINLTNFSFGSIGANLAQGDLTLNYTPALGSKAVVIAAGAAGFRYIPEPTSLLMLSVGMAGLLATRQRA